MANTKVAGGGAGQMKWVWMIVGIAMSVLFFWWISVSSEPSQVNVVTEEETADEAAAGGVVAPAVTLADLTGASADYIGQTVRLPSATITIVMGDNAFWVEGPGGNPFLVVKGDEFLTTGGVTLQQGATVSITGEFWEQNAQTIQQWRDSGFMTDGGHLAQAEFATHYIQARQVGAAEAAAATTGQ